MKYFAKAMIASFLLITSLAHSQEEYVGERVYFSYCSIYTSSSFESCVGRNFSVAETEWRVFLNYCFGLDTSPNGFESCVNSNFSRLGSELNIFLGYCYGAVDSKFSFESCVNSNFDRLSQ